MGKRQIRQFQRPHSGLTPLRFDNPPGKKRFRISTNDLYCQKRVSLTYILPLVILVYVYYFSRTYL